MALSALGGWSCETRRFFMKTMLSAPVPPKLRELLRDYPELIDEIEDGLNGVLANPYHGTPIIDQAIWLLEDTLGKFALKAQSELKDAENSGDVAAIERAKAKQASVFKARPKQAWLIGLDEFEQYAKAYRAGGVA
jgi:hypothetical protein